MSNFELAQSCINRIDDYLEYRYKSHLLPQDLRDRILEFIDDYTQACVEHANTDEELIQHGAGVIVEARERAAAATETYRALYLRDEGHKDV